MENIKAKFCKRSAVAHEKSDFQRMPDVLRGATVPVTIAFQFLKSHKMGGENLSVAASAATVGTVCLLIAFWAWSGLEETHGKDLDYLEPN
jgi:hypothetical protein